MALELTIGNAAPIIVDIDEDGSVDFGDVASATLTIRADAGATPMFTKSGVVADHVVTVTPTQGEADAWTKGSFLAAVKLTLNNGTDRHTDTFVVRVREAVA